MEDPLYSPALVVSLDDNAAWCLVSLRDEGEN